MPKAGRAVTRIVCSRNLNCGKYERLCQQAKILGRLRQEIWHRFGSINGVGIDHRQIRGLWVKERDFSPLAAKAWKETLRDCLDDIKLYEESAKEKVRKAIYKRSNIKDEQKKYFSQLKNDTWVKNKYLCRKMRKYKKHGKTKVNNQIIVEYGVYKQFKGKDGRTWIRIPSLVRRELVAIPLDTNMTLTGCLRIILKSGRAYVHYTIEPKNHRPCGDAIIGVDKGYSEAFTDSLGNRYGLDFGKIMTVGTKKINGRGKARNKLFQLAKRKTHKRKNIEKYNLGNKKLENSKNKQRKILRDIAFKSVHSMVDKAQEIRAEDLSATIKKKNPWKGYNRRMSAWAKGSLQEALETVPKARGSRLRLINCAYTSQMDSNTNQLSGRRVGDKFYHANGVVSDADVNAALNIKHRGDDAEITLYTSHRKVKQILLNRLSAIGGVSESLQTRNRPSMTPVTYEKSALTESELLENVQI